MPSRCRRFCAARVRRGRVCACGALADPSQTPLLLGGTGEVEERLVELGTIEEVGTTTMGRELSGNGQFPEGTVRQTAVCDGLGRGQPRTRRAGRECYELCEPRRETLGEPLR